MTKKLIKLREGILGFAWLPRPLELEVWLLIDYALVSNLLEVLRQINKISFCLIKLSKDQRTMSGFVKAVNAKSRKLAGK